MTPGEGGRLARTQPPTLSTQTKRVIEQGERKNAKRLKHEVMGERWGEGDRWETPQWEPRPSPCDTESPSPLPQRKSGRPRGSHKDSPKQGFLKIPSVLPIAKVCEILKPENHRTEASPFPTYHLRWKFRTQMYLTWVPTKPVVLYLRWEGEKSPQQVTPSLGQKCQEIDAQLEPPPTQAGGTRSQHQECECITTYYAGGSMRRSSLCSQVRSMLGYHDTVNKVTLSIATLDESGVTSKQGEVAHGEQIKGGVKRRKSKQQQHQKFRGGAQAPQQVKNHQDSRPHCQKGERKTSPFLTWPEMLTRSEHPLPPITRKPKLMLR